MRKEEKNNNQGFLREKRLFVFFFGSKDSFKYQQKNLPVKFNRKDIKNLPTQRLEKHCARRGRKAAQS